MKVTKFVGRISLTGLLSAGMILSGIAISNAETSSTPYFDGGQNQPIVSPDFNSDQGVLFDTRSNSVRAAGSDPANLSGISIPGVRVEDSKAIFKDTELGSKFEGKGEPIITTKIDGATTQTFETLSGSQTLISIPNANAASEYRFPLEVPSGGSVQLQLDGSVNILNAAGTAIGGITEPWAVDANGKAIETNFTFEGNTLIQRVSFNENTAFPVTADPQFWQMAISTAAGSAVGAAMLALVKVPWVAGAAGGCMTGSLNAMWDGGNFWDSLWGCISTGALGAFGAQIAKVVKDVLARFNVKP